MKLTAEVVDPAFVEVNDAKVVAQVTSPSGKMVDVPMEWSVSKDGDYRGSFVPDEPGLYEIKATAVAGRRPSSAPAFCTRARRPATASTSTRRCGRRCSSASPKRPAAASSRRRGVGAAGGDQLQRPRRDRRRRARPVGHADSPDAPAGACSARSGVTGERGGWRECAGRTRLAIRLAALGLHRRPRSCCSPWARCAAAPAAALAQDTHLILIAGVGGSEEHIDAVQQVGDRDRRRREEARRRRREHHLSR